MGTYTDYFEKKTYEILQEEDYVSELKKVMGEFRSFDEALDRFIQQHGYHGDIEDIDAKTRFISEKCIWAGVPVPRNLKKWYTEGIRMERNSKVPFQLCFAFGLNADEANDFLHRICLARGIDCHLSEEAVFYYALQKELTYSEAEEIQQRVNHRKPDKMEDAELLYTDLIEDEIDRIDTVDELIEYLNENEEKFSYNNATACEAIQILWEEIAGTDTQKGLAKKEREAGYLLFDREEAAQRKYEAEKGRKKRKRMEDSIWETYLQILGIAGNYVSDCYQGRSLKQILKGNELIHPLAEAAFPDRDGLNKILHGVHVSYERIRKLLILLTFYKYYVKRLIRQQQEETVSDQDDAQRCISYINSNLTRSNYMILYPGNPYDFLILMAIRTEDPLFMFREYMHEVYFSKVDLDALY